MPTTQVAVSLPGKVIVLMVQLNRSARPGAKRRTYPLARLAWASLGLVLAACGAPQDPPEIRIGLLATMEGPYREASGLPSKRGADLAVEEWNARGGVVIDGVPRRIRLVVRSYDNRADDAAAQARALLNQDSVHAIIGPQLSSHAIPVAQMAEQVRVVMISPMSSNAETTAGKRYVFRLAFLDAFQGYALASFATEDLGARTAAVLFEETSQYSRGLAAEFRRRFEAAGGRIVASEHFLADDGPDYRDQLRRIGAAKPDVLLLPNAMGADTLQVRQMEELGIDIQVLGTDTWDLQWTPKLAGTAHVFVTHQWHYQMGGPQVEAFLRRFREAYDRLPRTTAAMTYDATNLLLTSMQKVGSVDSDDVRSVLATTTDFLGVTGRISFDGTGNPHRSAAVSHLENGKPVLDRVIDP